MSGTIQAGSTWWTSLTIEVSGVKLRFEYHDLPGKPIDFYFPREGASTLPDGYLDASGEKIVWNYFPTELLSGVNRVLLEREMVEAIHESLYLNS